MEGIAVDTHVFRIAHRLKFAGPSADTPAKTEAALLKLYPREYWGPHQHQWGAVRPRNVHRPQPEVRDMFPLRPLPQLREGVRRKNLD